MAKKMYYSEEEAAGVLKCTVEQITAYAREGKVQQYQDGDRKVYRADQIDQFAKELAMEDTGEIELAPADTSAGDAVSLEEADVTQEAEKEDTVIAAEGVSIFDDEDLEIEVADPMAKTQIAPSLEEQLSGDGAGSGSGLLDLTRESDDTSLGPEVLENIEMGSSISGGIATEPPPEELITDTSEVVVAEVPGFVEQGDPMSGLFSGFLVGSAVVAMLLGVVMFSAMAEQAFGLVEALKNNMAVLVLVATVIVVGAGVVGMVLGKSVVTKQPAAKKTGD